MTKREEKLLLFAALAAAAGSSGTVWFWQAFGDNTERVLDIQRRLKKEVVELESELWPPDEGW